MATESDASPTTELISTPAERFVRDSIEVIEMFGIMHRNAELLALWTESLCNAFRPKLSAAGAPTADDIIAKMKGPDGPVAFVQKYIPISLEMMLCRSADNFLCYVSELLALIFRTKPGALKPHGDIELRLILQHSDYLELLGAITEKIVEKLSMQGMDKLNSDLKKSIGFPLTTTSGDFDAAKRIIAKRNLIVHRRGLIDRTYLAQSGELVCLSLGRKLSLDGPSVLQDMTFLAKVVTEIDRRAAKQFGISRTQQRPVSKHMINFSI